MEGRPRHEEIRPPDVMTDFQPVITSVAHTRGQGNLAVLDLPDWLALLGLERVFGTAGCPVARQG